MARAHRARLLLVEDDDAMGRAIEELLALEGYHVRRVRNGADAIDLLRDFTPDALIVDLGLPVMDGRSFVELYRRRAHPAPSVIVMSGRSDGLTIAQALGAEAYLSKPIDARRMLRALSLALAAA